MIPCVEAYLKKLDAKNRFMLSKPVFWIKKTIYKADEQQIHLG